MKGLSDKEIEILLLLFKDFSTGYNANSITNRIKITPAGAFKSLRNLEKRKLVIGKRMGKARFYKANLDDYYSFRTIETLLINEARVNAPRWIFEFRDLFDKIEIAVIFGSVIKNPEKAGDIDLLLVLKKEKNRAVNGIIEEKGKLSRKVIHVIKQTPDDMSKNLRKGNKVVLNAIKNGYVLHGHDKLLKVVKNVTSF